MLVSWNNLNYKLAKYEKNSWASSILFVGQLWHSEPAVCG